MKALLLAATAAGAAVAVAAWTYRRQRRPAQLHDRGMSTSSWCLSCPSCGSGRCTSPRKRPSHMSCSCLAEDATLDSSALTFLDVLQYWPRKRRYGNNKVRPERSNPLSSCLACQWRCCLNVCLTCTPCKTSHPYADSRSPLPRPERKAKPELSP